MLTEAAHPTPKPAVSEPQRPSSSRGLKTAGIAALVVAGAAVGYGVLARHGQVHQAQTWADAQSIPTVGVTHPVQAQGGRTLTLPGQLEAYNAANIYARVSGYIKAWDQDIGAHVRAGQVLATLDTPDLDQQVMQARADLASTQANQRLSASTARRWSDLLSSDAVSKQESDEKSGDLAAKTAMVRASQANLARLEALRAFAKITAPFAGVVTQRNANIGDLVTAGVAGEPLFTVSDVHKIRVYVRVPQNSSARLQPGIQGRLHLPEFPDRSFPATLERTSEAISGQSGTLLTELAADNPGGELKPGAFAQVDFALVGASQVLRLPASALIFRKEGLQVAVLDGGHHVHLRRIVVARDLGPQVEVGSGLQPGDQVIDNPPDSIREGELVRVAGRPHA